MLRCGERMMRICRWGRVWSWWEGSIRMGVARGVIGGVWGEY